MISLGVRRNHFILPSKNISVLEIALIVSYLNRIFVYYVARLIVMSFCALCYFIVVDTLIHFLNVLHCSASRLVKFACDNPPLFSKCKNR
jgi:hypothetical protein